MCRRMGLIAEIIEAVVFTLIDHFYVTTLPWSLMIAIAWPIGKWLFRNAPNVSPPSAIVRTVIIAICLFLMTGIMSGMIYGASIYEYGEVVEVGDHVPRLIAEFFYFWGPIFYEILVVLSTNGDGFYDRFWDWLFG